MRRSTTLLTTVILIFVFALASPLYAADSFSKVDVSKQSVTLSATLGIEQVRYFTLDSPKRLVVDLYGVKPGEHRDEYQLSDGFRLLRVGPLDNKTRFVLDVMSASFPIFNVNVGDDKVDITWESSQHAASGAISAPQTLDSQKITAIDFSSGDGQSKIFISLSGSVLATEPIVTGNKIQFSFKNTTLPQSLRRVFDTLAFPSAIYSATPYLINDSGQPEVKFVVILKGKVPSSLKKTLVGYEFVVEDMGFGQSTTVLSGIKPLSAQGQTIDIDSEGVVSSFSQGGESSSSLQVASVAVPVIQQLGAQETTKYSGEKTSLVFDSADVRDILRLIAEISDLNIIASDDVKGNVSLRLIDVPWDQALDLILDVSSLGMIQQGNVVRVLPKSRIRSMKEAELTAVRSQEKLETLVTEVITVSYADLGNVSGPVSKILSDRGTLTPDARNKLLIITDVLARITKARELISILDTPERQVMIEARIVEVNSTYSRDLGVHWGVFAADDATAGGSTRSFQSMTGGGGDPGSGFIIDGTNSAVGNALGTAGLTSQMRFGRTLIDNIVLDLQLEAMEASGDGKIVSSPRVTTMNGEKATISQGTTIPYQTSGQDGPKTEFVAAELKLEVTPVINPDGSIILEILATKDSPGQVLNIGAAPSIDTKKAETKVLIHDGETTVIGGIFVETTSDNASGIPVLKDIPFLGNLFKSQHKKQDKAELLIFITPRIMYED